MKKWNWLFYGFFLSYINFGALKEILDPDSAVRSYYTVLIAFNKTYLLYLLLNTLNVIVNLFIPLVVCFYALNISSSLRFWKILFAVRILLDATGHHYDMQFLKSAVHQTKYYFWASLAVFILPLLPSYIAHYLYIFKRTENKLTRQ